MKYPSDITTKQWNIVRHLFENENRGKHFQEHTKRRLINAVLYWFEGNTAGSSCTNGRYCGRACQARQCIKERRCRRADSAFELGCDRVNGTKNIYIPWKGFNNRNDGIVPDFEASKPIVMRTHPAPQRLTRGAMKLHCRNPYQILGEGLAIPSKFVVAYTTNGELRGGTATALRLAMENNIPILNLGAPKHLTVNQFLQGIGLHPIFQD